jgi:hypothetical protein
MQRARGAAVDESIYDLIPPVYEAAHKGKMHKSKFNSVRSAPTYSTFPRKEEFAERDSSGGMLFAGRSGAIGRDVGPDVDPKNFLKAHGSGRDTLPEKKAFTRATVKPTRDGVPDRTDKPVMGLVTEKNFVHGNAVDAICSAPQRTKVDAPLAVHRKDFGQAPKYLGRVKQCLDIEKTMVAEGRSRDAEMQANIKSQYVRQVDSDERDELVASLRSRWEELHSQYQSLPFARDTAMQIARKEGIEKDLKEIETALEKLSRNVVVVYNDAQNPHVTQWAKGQATAEAQSSVNRLVNSALVNKKK